MLPKFISQRQLQNLKFSNFSPCELLEIAVFQVKNTCLVFFSSPSLVNGATRRMASEGLNESETQSIDRFQHIIQPLSHLPNELRSKRKKIVVILGSGVCFSTAANEPRVPFYQVQS